MPEKEAVTQETLSDAKSTGRAIYDVEVKTADELSAGTDGEILLSIYGNQGEELKVPLNKSWNHKDLFEKNALDKFELELKDIGKITKISVEQSGKNMGSWKLEFVKIFHHSLHYR